MTQKELLRIRCNVYHLSIAQTSSLSIEILILWSPLYFTVTLLVANTFSEGSSWLRFNLITLVQHSGDCRLPPAAQPAWHVPHTGLILQKGTQPPSAGTLGNKKFPTPGLSELLHKYLKEKVGSVLLPRLFLFVPVDMFCHGGFPFRPNQSWSATVSSVYWLWMSVQLNIPWLALFSPTNKLIRLSTYLRIYVSTILE